MDRSQEDLSGQGFITLYGEGGGGRVREAIRLHYTSRCNTRARAQTVIKF